MPKQPTSIRLDEDVIKQIDAVREEYNLSRARFIYQAIEFQLLTTIMNIVSSLTTILGYLEGINICITKNRKTLDKYRPYDINIVFDAISEWMNICDKYQPMLTIYLDKLKYPYKDAVESEINIALRRLHLNRLFFGPEMEPPFEERGLKRILSMMKNTDEKVFDEYMYFNYIDTITWRYKDFIVSLRKDINMLIELLDREIKDFEELNFRRLRKYLADLKNKFIDYLTILDKSMNKIKTYRLINILEYIKIHYPGGTMIIKKIAERPRKIDDILRIGREYALKDRDIIDMIRWCESYKVIVRKGEIFYISEDMLDKVRKRLNVAWRL